MTTSFKNHPLTDFSIGSNREMMFAALEKIRSELGREYPLIINNKAILTDDKIKSINPSKKNETVGIVQKADANLAIDALDNAWEAFDSWKKEPVEKRAGLLFKAADIMRSKMFELSATMVVEIGKSWVEADADTAEAIDFLEFYARETLRLSKGHGTTPYPNETNELFYIPLGAGVAIPPWNFPLAILAGITVSGVVCGNTMVLKPASDTPIIACKFMEIMLEAGLKPGVINFITGSGSDAGEALVKNSRTRFINFTGSKEVGLHIIEEGGKCYDGQKWIKRVIAEMGGKDAIIVDSETDIDKAVEAVVASAFGFQGQKCSACSRAIVDKKIYDLFVEKIVPRVKSIKTGDPSDPSIHMGPVSSKSSFDKIMKYIEIGKKEGKLICGGKGTDSEGFFIEPTVFADVSDNAKISQEEIFGPVLSIIRSNDYDESLRIANGTDYGLTGAVMTNNPEKIKRAREEFFVGNLYINRKCTGALVDVQPFGGYNMSGTCSKAGGRDYLLFFLQAKSFCQRLVP